MKELKHFLKKYKYEVLLFGLLQHTFIAAVLPSLSFYTEIIWPINMIILAFTCYGVFHEKGKLKTTLLKILIFFICLFPIIAPYTGYHLIYMQLLSIAYTLFFGFVFYEVIVFLIKPSYINKDIITASACGYLLLIEISTFLMQSFYYFNTNSYKGLDLSHPAATYIDFVYYSSIVITSIGFGDILPNSHQTKLITAMFGIVGQFYSVVLVGILISKFSSKEK